MKTRSPYFLPFAVILGVVLTVAGIEAWRSFKAAPKNAPATTGSGGFPKTLTDGTGAKVTISRKPLKIVSQTLATDEILLEILPPERLVALSEVADDPKYSFCAERAKAVKARCTNSAEEILKLEPDMIFVASYSRAELVQLLKASGAPVYRFSHFDSIADVRANIRALGEATGSEPEAEALIKKMDDRISAANRKALASGKKLRVLSFSSSNDTAGGGTSFDDVLKALNCVNVATENGVSGFRQVSSEQLTRWNPDYIVTSAPPGRAEDVRRKLLQNPAVAATPAGRPERIIVVESRAFTAISHNIADCVEQIAEGLFR